MNNTSLLANCLTQERILIRAEISSRKKLLQHMASLLCSALDDEVREKEIYQQLWEREKLGNTGIGNGVALPHSRTNQTSDAVIAIITLDDPVDYDASDRQNVDLAFGLLVPQEANQGHLNLLADIARLVSDTDKKAALVQAQSAQSLRDLIINWSQLPEPN